MFYAFSSTILSCVYLYSIYPCFCRVYCLPAICVFLICTLPHRLCWLVWGGGAVDIALTCLDTLSTISTCTNTDTIMN